MTTKRLRRNGWALVGTVASDSRSDTEYEIKRSPDGTLGCACMGWAMRKHCHHLDAWSADYRPVPVRAGRPEASVPQMVPAHVTVAGEVFIVRRAISFGAF